MTLAYRCGGSTRWLGRASCFPFNCLHEYAGGHQNSAIVKLAVTGDNTRLAIATYVDTDERGAQAAQPDYSGIA